MSLGTPQYLAILCKAAILALMRILCLAVMLSAGVAINEAAATSLKPIEQGALQATLDAVAKRLMVPGAMVLVRTPEGEYFLTYGTTKLGDAIAPRAETHFRIASNTKTMTSAVVMLMIQEGKLSLTDAVSKYISGVPNGGRPSVVTRAGVTPATVLADRMARDFVRDFNLL